MHEARPCLTVLACWSRAAGKMCSALQLFANCWFSCSWWLPIKSVLHVTRVHNIRSSYYSVHTGFKLHVPASEHFRHLQFDKAVETLERWWWPHWHDRAPIRHFPARRAQRDQHRCLSSHKYWYSHMYEYVAQKNIKTITITDVHFFFDSVIYVYIYVCVHLMHQHRCCCLYVHTYIHICKYIHIHIHMYLYTCVYV